MNEKPILFSGPMVRAILDGRKTMTRRVVKLPPDAVSVTVDPGGTIFGPGPYIKAGNPDGYDYPRIHCPYDPGDRLWVRETWCCYTPMLRNPRYKADGHNDAGWTWKPSIHMPRWASRITLEVTDVRVERVQEITDDDAKAEGCPTVGWYDGPRPKLWFSHLWDSINAARGYGWDVNPWVWVVSFRRVDQAEGKERGG